MDKRKGRMWRIGQILAVGHLQLKSGMSATLSAPFTGPYHGEEISSSYDETFRLLAQSTS